MNELIFKYYEGILDETERNALVRRLGSDPDCRRLLIREAVIRSGIHEWAKESLARVGADETVPQVPKRVAWPRLAVAAACTAIAVGAAWHFFVPREPRPGGEGAIAVTGRFLRPGDTVKTGTGEVVTVGFEGEETSLEVDGNTSLKLLDDAVPGKHLYLAKGSVGASVAPQPAGSPMTMKTPHAKVEVIGTRFWLRADDVETQLAVFQGRVRFTDTRTDGSAMVKMGECASAGREDIFHIEPLRTRGPELAVERTLDFPTGRMWMTAGLAASEDTLWMTGYRSMLIGIDPESGEVLGRMDLSRACGRKLRGLAWDGKHLWVGDGDAQAVRALDPDTFEVVKTVWVDGQIAHLAAGNGSLWVRYRGGRVIDEFDAESGTRRGSVFVFPLGYRWGTKGLACANGALWGVTQQGGIHRVWPVSRFPVVHFPSPDRVTASCLAGAGPGRFWVAVRGEPKIPELRLVKVAVPGQNAE